jgi:elongation factor G
MRRLIQIGIEVTDPAACSAFRTGLETLAAADPALLVEFGDDDLVAIVSCADEATALGLADRLRRTTGVRVKAGAPGVIYAERLAAPAEVDFTHKRQTGFEGQFARVKLRFEPLEDDAGFVFESCIHGGAVPAEFIPAVERGLQMARQNGLLAGYPVSDFRAVLEDGACLDRDSSPLAFEIAARGAFRELKRVGGVRLMEPVMNVEVLGAGQLAGLVRSVMHSRGAEEIAAIKVDAEAPLLFEAPLVRLLGLEAELADRTQGIARVRSRYSGLREVPRRPGGGDDTYPSDLGLRV